MTALDVPSASDLAQIELITTWLQSNLGGQVTKIEPQARWRPVWFVDMEDGSTRRELLVRGERADTLLPFPLEHEMRFQKVMQDQGIKVPKVYGWIDKPASFVMDRVSGEPNFVTATDAERESVVDEYVQELARLHTLDLSPFVTAGIDRASDPAGSGLLGIDRYEQRVYRAQKMRPDPIMEFGLSWFHRHPPRSRGREAPIVWDSGQVLHEHGHLNVIIDMELGHIGDPMMDLAGWRMRDSIIGFGNFAQIYDRYSQLVGEPVDLEAIQLHHIAFTYTNQLSLSNTLRNPSPNCDYTTNLQWCNETNIYTTEGIAEYLDVELPTVDVPDSLDTQVDAAHDHLIQILLNTEIAGEYARYRMRIAFRLARHLQRYTQIGRELERQDLDDIAQVIGFRPDSWLEGEALLEQFIIADAAEGARDDELLPLLHKRNLRAQMLNGPAGSAMSRHIPIQSFRD